MIQQAKCEKRESAREKVEKIPLNLCSSSTNALMPVRESCMMMAMILLYKHNIHVQSHSHCTVHIPLCHKQYNVSVSIYTWYEIWWVIIFIHFISFLVNDTHLPRSRYCSIRVHSPIYLITYGAYHSITWSSSSLSLPPSVQPQYFPAL